MDNLGVLGGLGALAFIIVGVGIVMWFLYSFGLFCMGRNRGVAYSWLAFLPIGNWYVHGAIVDSFPLGNSEINRLEIVYPAVMLVCSALSQIGGVGFIFGLIASVFSGFMLYYLYEQTSDNYIMKLVLSILFPFLIPIFVFMSRND